MDKKLFVHLQGGRKVSGTLRGYDLFLNLVLDDALEETTPAQKHPIGTVVRLQSAHTMLTLRVQEHLTRAAGAAVSVLVERRFVHPSMGLTDWGPPC